MHNFIQFISETSGVYVALIALSGVLITVSANMLIAYRNNYIGSITTERAKWIAVIRDRFAQFDAVIRKLSRDPVDAGAMALADELIANISMLLNPCGQVEKNIIAALADMPTLSAHTDKSELAKRQLLFIYDCQYLLKDEWERIKTEAFHPIFRYVRWIPRLCRSRRYPARRAAYCCELCKASA